MHAVTEKKKSEGRNYLENLRVDGRIMQKLKKKIGREDMDWFHLAQIQLQAIVNM
jgi:hypothetical protein